MTAVWVVAGVLGSTSDTAFAAGKNKANEFEYISARYQGTLKPIKGELAKILSGKTIILGDIMASRTESRIVEQPVYFGANGLSSSTSYLDRPWRASANRLCLEACYEALTDDTGQAFLRHEEDGHISRVVAIEASDSRDVRQLFAQMQAEEQAAQKAETDQMLGQAAMLMMLMQAGGGFGGGGGSNSNIDHSKEVERVVKENNCARGETLQC